MLKILIVEDEWVVSEELKEVIQDFNCEVIGQADDAKDTLKVLDREIPDVIFMDVNLKGEVDGIDLGKIITRQYPCRLVFLTSYSDSGSVKRAKAVTNSEIIFKPFIAPDIHSVLQKYLSSTD